MYYKKATYRDHFIKEFIKSLDTIETNINKSRGLSKEDSLELISISKDFANYLNNETDYSLNPGDKQSIIDLLHILLNIVFAVEEDNFEGVKKIIEQYGYMGKKEFVYQMINRMWDLGKEKK